METYLKQKTPQWRSKINFFRMLIPSTSKAKTSYYGTRSTGTVDYRNGADIRLLKQFKSKGYEVLKNKSFRTLKPVGL